MPRSDEVLRLVLCRNDVCSSGAVVPSADRSNPTAILFPLRGPLEATGLLTLRDEVPNGPDAEGAPAPARATAERMALELRAAFSADRSDTSKVDAGDPANLADGDRYTLSVVSGVPRRTILSTTASVTYQRAHDARWTCADSFVVLPPRFQ
jgi:hypothetical protein